MTADRGNDQYKLNKYLKLPATIIIAPSGLGSLLGECLKLIPTITLAKKKMMLITQYGYF